MNTTTGECPLCFGVDPHDRRMQLRVVDVVSEGQHLEDLPELIDIDDGTPLHPRVTICLDCYEHALRKAARARRDVRGANVPGAALYCRCCGHGLPDGTMILRCVPVLLRDDEQDPVFDDQHGGVSDPLCLECLRHVDDAYDQWPDLLGSEPDEDEEDDA